MADYCFSDDILVEILKTLPVKSLLRFRCVRKSWYHLIQSRYFINLHSHHNKNKYLLFHGRHHSRLSLRVDDDKQCKEYLPRLQFPVPIDIIMWRLTSRGLICFSIQHLDTHRVYLWNPIIRIVKTLPDSPIPYNDRNPNHLAVGRAFGYFPNMNDYKVIKFESSNVAVSGDRFAYTVYIFSLSTNSWTTERVLSSHRICLFYNSVVQNGVAYWVGCRHNPFIQVIVCYDMESNTIREIMLPPQYCRDVTFSTQDTIRLKLVQHFGELALSLVYINSFTKKLTLDILIGELNEVWTKKITLDLDKIGKSWRPIGFRNNGEIVLTNYKFGEGGFLSYNHDKEEASEMVDDSADLQFYVECVNCLDENLVLLGNE